MANLTVRNLDDAVYARLKRDAVANHRSVEAEARVRLGEPDSHMGLRKLLADRLEAAAVDPGDGYEGSVAAIRAIRDSG